VPSISRTVIDGYKCHRLIDKSAGRNLRYSVKLDKYTAKQWLQAHNAVMQSISPEERKNATGRQIRELSEKWLASPKKVKAAAAASGISLNLNTQIETSLNSVFEEYISDFCRPGINSNNIIDKAKRQSRILQEFLEAKNIKRYGQLKREHVAAYPEWRNAKRFDQRAGITSADTVNKELNRLAAVIKYGVKYHGWQERYLLDGIRVKPTTENTKAVRPFEIPETKAILAWLAANAEVTGNWYLHDMALLAVCAGLEAKALSLLTPEWFKLDLGILRVFDKLVSGVIDAKTQNRARDIPLTATLRKIFKRGYAFKRPQKKKGKVAKNATSVKDYARRTFARCEHETGIIDVNWHRFRHTCATARLSAGWQLIRVSRMLGHSNVNTTASHYAEYDLSASPAGFEGMIKVYGDFVRWLDEGYFI
jgi:integrase